VGFFVFRQFFIVLNLISKIMLTMRKLKLLSTVALLLTNTTLFAQDYTFRVLANKGLNQFRTENEWLPIKTGQSLKMNDELRITENASIGLVHVSGKPLEEKKAGTYKVADLAARVNTNSNVLNKYVDFILSSNSDEAKKNRLSATGSVHRGLGIELYLPRNQFANVSKNQVFLNWDESEKGPFIVRLLNMHDNVLLKVETSENYIYLDLNDSKLANETAILVEIQSKSTGKKTDKGYGLKRLSSSELKRIADSNAEIMKELSDEIALNKLMLASFYEQNKLIVDANTCYGQAITLTPDTPAYRDYYDEFLLRNKLKVLKP
jgi:hypothetical protein